MRYFHSPEDSLETSRYPGKAASQLHPRFSHSPDEEQTSQYPPQKVHFLLKLPVSPAEFSVEIPSEDLEKITTVADAMNYLTEHQA